MNSVKRFKLPIIAVLAVIITAVVLFSFTSLFQQTKIQNVILISIDTCRADYLSCYGYPRKTTPNIDSIADKAVLFNHVVAPVPFTLASHSSMLTGTTPLYHGVHLNIGYKLDQSNVTIAEVLKENGFNTGAVISSFVLDHQFGLDQGFRYYNDDFVRPMQSFYHNERRADEASQFACEWLERHKKEKSFLFLHYYDPHDVYQPPEPFATIFKDNPYAGEIAYVDHCIGRVIEKLKELKLYKSSLIIITADHGESLDEHSEVTHGYFIYQSALHVPLIIKVPGGYKGKKVDDLVGLIDIAPTIYSIMGIEIPPEVQGKDISQFCTKKGKGKFNSDERYVYCESFNPVEYNCSPLLGLVNGYWKYIQAPRQELYNLRNDPAELNNLAEKEPKRTRLFREHLKLIVTDHADNKIDSKSELTDETIKQLQSLGYVSSGSTTVDFEFDNTLNDPKDYINLHQNLWWLKTYMKLKMSSKAEPVSRQILKEYPDYVMNYLLLGKIVLERGNVSEAIKYLSEFLSRLDLLNKNNPSDKTLPDANINISEAYTLLGRAYSMRGDFEQALAHCSKAIELKPETPMLINHLGNIYLEQRKFIKAETEYKKALKLDPEMPEAHYGIGIALFGQEKFEKAVLHFKTVMRLNPNLLQVKQYLYTATKEAEKRRLRTK